MTLSLSLFEGCNVELWLCRPPNISHIDCPTWFPLFIAYTIFQNDFLWSSMFKREWGGEEGMLRALGIWRK